MIICELTGFILSCLDEDERDAGLFHEFACSAGKQQARDGFPGSRCRCPVPARALGRCQATRDIIANCERQLRRPGTGTPGLRPVADQILQVLGAIALPYELDPRWQEQWRP
jgi:hypothetical protein